VFSAIIDLRRYRSIALSLGLLGVVFGAVSVAMDFVFGPDPQWLKSDVTIDWGLYRTFGGRLAAAEDDVLNHRGPEKFGLILGHSSAQQGFDLPLMVRQYPEIPRWVVLMGSGGSTGIRNLTFHTALFERMKVRPAVIVAAVHPFFLARPAKTSQPSTESVIELLRKRQLENAFTALGDRIWLLRFRGEIGNFVYFQVQKWHERSCLALNLPNNCAFPYRQDAWASDFVSSDGQMTPRRFAEKQAEYWAIERFKRPEYFPPECVDDAVRLVEQLSRFTDRVVLELMPEHSGVRARTPSHVADMLTMELRKRFPGVPIFANQMAVADDLFWDSYHLNARGRAKNSSILIEQLKATPQK
jgi:hypothetical protein